MRRPAELKRATNDVGDHRTASGTARQKTSACQLQPFKHQVGGRASIFCYDGSTLCKPFVSRELYFYCNLPQCLTAFTPQFRGLITVELLEDGSAGAVVAKARPETLIQPDSVKLSHTVDVPKPHSKRCVKDFRTAPQVVRCCDQEKRPGGSGTKRKVATNVCNDKSVEIAVLADTLGNKLNVACATSLSGSIITSAVAKGLWNPWNNKAIEDNWTKLNKNDGCKKSRLPVATKRFMLLENVLARYQHPCVLDVKVGTRMRANPSREKQARNHTTIRIGARLSGMQIYNPVDKVFSYFNKYHGHNLSVDSFNRLISEFFCVNPIHSSPDISGTCDQSTGTCDQLTGTCDQPTVAETRRIGESLVRGAVVKLRELRDAVCQLQSHRFYSGSLLFVYEGDAGVVGGAGDERRRRGPRDDDDVVDVRFIDFAHYCWNDSVMHPGPDGGLLFGLSNLIAMLEAMLKT